MSDSGSATPSGLASSSTLPEPPKDRHEPRGRKPNDKLPPSRAREVQRAFRLRRAEHLASLEERINALEAENSQLRRLLNIPDADRPKIGTGPTGRGKSLREGGVPMSERVRARREAARAREKQNKELGLPSDPNDKADMELDSDHDLDDEDGEGDGGDQEMRDGAPSGRGTPGISPKGSMPPPQSRQQPSSSNSNSSILPMPLFQPPPENSAFNYELPLPFNTPLSPNNPFNDFESAIFKPPSAGDPFASMFAIYDDPTIQHQPPPPNRQYSHPDHLNQHLQSQHSGPSQNHNRHGNGHHAQSHSSDQSRASPISPPVSNSSGATPAQPELLTRLKQCCHLSDSHVVNDPGLLIFATRLCQSFPCSYGGGHPESLTAISDSDYLLLDDSWRALRNQLDPGTDNDGENRINTGRMASELVIRAAQSRGQGAWVVCRFREGMSIRRSLIGGLINGLGGNFE